MGKEKSYSIVVVGCGRLGSYVANKLSSAGHGVIAIDSEPEAFDSLSAEFSGFRIEGDATEFAVLKKAKLQDADIVIAVTRDDNVNLMIAQIAKVIFNVPTVVARVGHPERERIFGYLGVDAICPTVVAAEVILDKVVSSLISADRGRQE